VVYYYQKEGDRNTSKERKEKIMEEKKMILVTDGYDDKPICVASNTIAARKSALDYLENQYDDGEWEAILEEDGYENRDDLFHDMMLGMESEWERFNINFAEVSFAGVSI
jgi:hypothetical protein